MAPLPANPAHASCSLVFGVSLHLERLELKLHVCNVAWSQPGCTDVHPPWAPKVQL